MYLLKGAFHVLKHDIRDLKILILNAPDYHAQPDPGQAPSQDEVTEKNDPRAQVTSKTWCSAEEDAPATAPHLHDTMCDACGTQ